MTGPVKAILIIVIALLILTPIVIFVVIPKVKRSKLAQALADATNEKAPGLLTKDEILTGLNKISNSEVDTLIDFFTKMQAKDWAGVAALTPEITKILPETCLQDKLFA